MKKPKFFRDKDKTGITNGLVHFLIEEEIEEKFNRAEYDSWGYLYPMSLIDFYGFEYREDSSRYLVIGDELSTAYFNRDKNESTYVYRDRYAA
jgi:hypothetical protein